jgi:hypothetical protein
MFILSLTGPHVKHFNDGNQTVCPTLKNKLWPLIIPKQRERCLAPRTLLITNHDLLCYNRPVHFIKNALRKCFRERLNFRQ